MDKVSDFESEDCEFESRQGHLYFLVITDTDAVTAHWRSLVSVNPILCALGGTTFLERGNIVMMKLFLVLFFCGDIQIFGDSPEDTLELTLHELILFLFVGEGGISLLSRLDKTLPDPTIEKCNEL